MSCRTHASSEVLDFLEHIESHRIFTVDKLNSLETCSFVPSSALRRFLTPHAIKRLLLCYFPSGNLWKAIHHGEYMIVFTVLLYIGKLSYFPYFVSSRKLSDLSLPFFHHHDWPRPCQDVFLEFQSAQWQFCAQSLDDNTLFDLRIDERVILPFEAITPLKEGPDSCVYLAELHQDYNLIRTESNEIYSTNKFVLKTYKAKNVETFNLETDAYRLLGDQQDIQSLIVKFHGSWSRGGIYVLLFDYCDGGTLTEFMRNTNAPSCKDDVFSFWKSLLELTKLLVRIHSLPLIDNRFLQGIHHDIKPDNILTVLKPGSSEYDVFFKMADFGIAEFKSRPTKISTRTGITLHNPGTQMFSAPEYFIEENDIFLLKTPMQAEPSKDIWALGCVFSQAAVWSVLGNQGLLEYERARIDETYLMSKLQNTAHSGCFHNGHGVLSTVSQFQIRACNGRLVDDCFVEDITGLVHDMLVHALNRPTAVAVYLRTREILTSAIKRYGGHPPHEKDQSVQKIERRQPPELPPQLPRNYTGFYDDQTPKFSVLSTETEMRYLSHRVSFRDSHSDATRTRSIQTPDDGFSEKELNIETPPSWIVVSNASKNF